MPPTILTVNTIADQNDGNAANGLSLRDAILITNANPNTEYEIHLTGGATYTLTANGINEDAAITGDLDIKFRNNVLYIGAFDGQKATIDASGLLNSDRVFHVLTNGALSLQNVIVTGGISTSGGGGINVERNGFLDLYNATITNNSVQGILVRGGGISNAGTAHLRNGSIISNNNNYGIDNSGTLLAINSSINNNRLSGILNSEILTLINTTVSNNTGGGIYNNDGSVALVNSTISGNSRDSGGGIYNSEGVINVLNSTITNNTAVGFFGGGGIVNRSASGVNLKNSIVAGNLHTGGGELDLAGIFNGNNNNLIGDLAGAQGTVGTGTDIVNPNPKLGPLQNNGGLTLTHALLAGSPAINAGNNAVIAADTEDIDRDGDKTEQIPFDQRGLARVSGTKVDIGAFEVQSAVLPTLSINDVTVTEGNSGSKNATFTVSLSAASTTTVTVNYATANNTATAGSDYTATNGILTFNPGEISKTFTVAVTGDTTVEANETFLVNLTSPSNATLADAQGVGTITDNDTNTNPTTISIADTSITEGNSGSKNATFTVSLAAASTATVTVNYATADNTATAGSDYTASNGILTFNPGETNKTVTVAVSGDTTVEPNETFLVNLTNPSNATIADAQGIGTILNDDSGSLPTLSINDLTVVEGQDGQALLTVTLSSASNQPITVNYATTAGTAKARKDYSTSSGTLTFAANTTTATLSIPILNDNLNEPNETFKVTLSNPTNATLQKATATVTITDTLSSSTTTTLPSGVENLTLTGTGNINGTGNSNNNILAGNSANNLLTGGDGNDTYQFNASTPLGSDTISESTTGGLDTLDFSGTTTSLRVNLGITTTQTVNNNLKLTLSANNAIENVMGSNNSDRLIGNSLNNTLNGSSGNDILTGKAGTDALIGGAGDDILSGGADSDSFTYSSGRAFTTGDIGSDLVTDFTAGSDKLVLSKATFAALKSSAGNGLSQVSDFAVVEDDELAATSTAFVVYSNSSGSLYYNQNGSATGLGTGGEFANLLNLPTLASADFAIVA